MWIACRRWSPLATVVVAGLAGAPTLAAAPERPWIEVRSPHFVVMSDATEKAARRVAWQFEQVHSLVPRLWPWARVTLPRPILVIAARDEGSMKALLPEYWERKDAMHPSAILVSGRDRHFVAVRADVEIREDEMRMNPYRMAYWAYVMLILEQSFEQPLPLWFARGITEVFSNTIVRDDDVELGRVNRWHLQRLREGQFLSFAKLRSVDRSSPYYTQGDKLDVFDANAWALIHYLMFADQGAYQKELNRFSALLQAGYKPEVALAEAFPDLATVERKAEAYAHTLAFSFTRLNIDLDVKQEGFTLRPLGAAEAAGGRAAFHVAMNRPAEAHALLETGRKADPASPAVLDAEGLLAEREDRPDDAKAAFAKAAEQPGASYYALYRHAQALHQSSGDQQALARIESALRRALEQNNVFSYAYSYLAETLTQLGNAAEAEGLALRAVSLEPGEAYHHVALARVLSSLNRPEDARREAEKGLALSRSPEAQVNARRMLEFLSQSQQAPARRASAHAAEATAVAENLPVESCRTGDAAACARVAPAYERACGEDDAQACAAVAWFHEQGKGVPRDFERAVAFYLMACNLGEKRGCLAQAVLQADGKGLPKNETQARATAERLCGEGMNEGCTFLATLHLRKGTPKDMSQARGLLTGACSAKEERACLMLKSLPAR
jgi:TPR repeat protein